MNIPFYYLQIFLPKNPEAIPYLHDYLQQCSEPSFRKKAVGIPAHLKPYSPNASKISWSSLYTPP